MTPTSSKEPDILIQYKAISPEVIGTKYMLRSNGLSLMCFFQIL